MLTDNEVTKALECCISNGGCIPTGCPMINECRIDIKSAEKYALSIINRQKAEIERLKAEVDKVNHDYILLCSDVAENRAEAIKEVFEKLEERLFVHSFKTKSDDYTQGQVDCMDFVDSKVEELKKEMVGNK